MDHKEKDKPAETASVGNTKEGETDNEDIEEQIDSEEDNLDEYRSSNQEQEDEDVQVASTEEEEKGSDEEEIAKPLQTRDSSDPEAKMSVDKEKAPSFAQDGER